MSLSEFSRQHDYRLADLHFLPSTGVKVRVEESDPGTLWPRQRLQSARRNERHSPARGSRGGRGEFRRRRRLSPSEPTAHKLYFLPKWSPSADACGSGAAGGRKPVILKGGPRSGPVRSSRGRRIWVRLPCLPCLRRPAVSARSPSSRLSNIPLSLPRMFAQFCPLSSACPPQVFIRSLTRSS